MKAEELVLGMKVRVISTKDIENPNIYGGEVVTVVGFNEGDSDCLVMFDNNIDGHNSYRIVTTLFPGVYLNKKDIEPHINHNLWWIPCDNIEFVDFPELDLFDGLL